MRRLSFFRANHKARPCPVAKRARALPQSASALCRKACPRPAAKRARALPQSVPVPCRKARLRSAEKRACGGARREAAFLPQNAPASAASCAAPLHGTLSALPRQKIFPPPEARRRAHSFRASHTPIIAQPSAQCQHTCQKNKHMFVFFFQYSALKRHTAVIF